MRRLITGVLVLLLFAALVSWLWYFATRPDDDRHVAQGKYSDARPPRVKVAPLKWRAATAKERNAAIASIVAQLKAFRDDDYELATKYQSQGLKKNFSSVENFRRIIQDHYPQFADYSKARFGAARATVDGKLVEVPIVLTGQDDVVVRATYTMVLEGGLYRVAGVSGGQMQSLPSKPPLPPPLRKVAPLLT